MWRNKKAEPFTLNWELLLRFPFALGLIASLGQAPFGVPLVSLIGFALGFYSLRRAATMRGAAWIGWRFGLGYFVLSLHWLVSPFLVDAARHAWMAPFAVLFMAGGLALFWGVAFAISHRLGSIALLMTMPLAELARAYVFTGFPWAMPAYGAVDTWLGQGAALVGSHGVNLLFLATAFALSQSICARGGTRKLALVSAMIGTALLWPLPASETAISPDANAATVRLVQPNAPQHLKWDPDYIQVFYDRALDFSTAPGAPDLIVWPETSLPASLPGGADILAEIASATNGTPMVIGANRFEGFRLYNAAVLTNEKGEITQTYDKQHLVPFGEYVPFGDWLAQLGIHGLAASEGRGFSAGSTADLMDLGPLGRALVLICYEAVFPQDVARSPERPDFLLHLTNDAWFGSFAGPQQHLVQSRMRAIEQGLPMLRAANTGISALIDDKGRIVKALPLNEAGFLDVPLPPPAAPTFYSHTRDFPISILLTVALLGLWIKRRRNSN
ncbi:apolipoprotein N-acyltransferase [Cognatishimia maritima]|uniref:Apolipoprotein N-acyltransferase n=1 Tax=Cognatishimia maritima TaxID=870908 RepID=A0A1M5KAU2_9RHOB|nr:apolipoprotein N-acyltransferase [Cognatishimia maritima]SHG49858.1 apolipoprotein N-acyltransferase [Cognatishimia maritima]